MSVSNNYRCISLLSVEVSVWVSVLIEKIKRYTENVLLDVQCGFGDKRDCVDYFFFFFFLLRSVCGKYL